MSKSPSNIPHPIMEFPLAYAKNVAAGCFMRCSFKFKLKSVCPSAGEGNPENMGFVYLDIGKGRKAIGKR